MTQRLLLAAYALALLAFSLVHDVRLLSLGFVVCAVLAGRRAPQILRRATLAVLLFSISVSAGVVIAGLVAGSIDVEWLVRTNLRVLLLTTLTLVAAQRIDLARALAPWPGLLVLITVAGAQIRLLQRQLGDLRLGLRSRSMRRPTASTLAHHAASSGAQFLGRALHDAEEIGLAMQARGAWHVRGE